MKRKNVACVSSIIITSSFEDIISWADYTRQNHFSSRNN